MFSMQILCKKKNFWRKKHVVRLPDQRWDADPEEQREKNRLQAQDQLGAPHDAHTIPPME